MKSFLIVEPVFWALLLAAHMVQCALIGLGGPASLAHPILKTRFSHRDLHERIWSQSTTILSRQGKQYHYGNYTASGFGDGPKWTSRQKVNPAMLERRGYGLDNRIFPNALWSDVLEPDDDNIYHIPLCFENQDAMNRLLCVYPPAAATWNAKLRNRVGIRFNVKLGRPCRRNAQGQIPQDADQVVIRYDRGNTGESTCGRVPQAQGGRSTNFWTKMDPTLFTNPHWHTAISTAVHELGHVLGLMHEHQRPDVDDWLYVYPQDIPGHDRLQNYLRTNLVQWPNDSKFKRLRIDMYDAYKYAELSTDGIREMGQAWDGGSWVQYSVDRRGLDSLNHRSYHQMLGDFDRQSIMLYPSNDRDHPILYYRGANGGPPTHIPVRYEPSEGDIAAVAMLYPLPR